MKVTPEAAAEAQNLDYQRTKLEAEISRLKTKVDTAVAEQGRIAGLETELARLETELSRMKVTPEAAAEAQNLDYQRTKLEAKISRLKTKVYEAIAEQGRIAGLEIELTRLETNLAKLQTTKPTTVAEAQNTDSERSKIEAEIVRINALRSEGKQSISQPDMPKSKTDLESKFNKRQSLIRNKNPSRIRENTASVEVSNLMDGTPKLDPATKRPKWNDNDVSHLTETVDYSAYDQRQGPVDVTSHPLRQWRFDEKLRIAFGRMLLTRNMVYNRPEIRQVIKNYIAKALKPRKNTNTIRDGKETAELFSRKEELRGKIAKVLGPAIEIVTIADDISDYLDVFTMFMADSFFYCSPEEIEAARLGNPNGCFPDSADMLSAGTMTSIQTRVVQTQIDRMTAYNRELAVKRRNDSEEDERYKLFPLIAGPLDTVDMELARTNHDPYWNLIRITTEIDAVRLRLIHDETTDHYRNWIDKVGDVEFYTKVKNDASDSLVNYVHGFFTVKQEDQLFREAYSNVCAYHGGIVYEDIRPALDTKWSGRPRFQCGYKSMTACHHAADSMVNGTTKGGVYGEWYNFSDLNTIISRLSTEPSSGSITPIWACSKSTLTSDSYTAACNLSSININGDVPPPSQLQILYGGEGYTVGTCTVNVGGTGRITLTVSDGGSQGGIITGITSTSGNVPTKSAPSTIDFSPCGSPTREAVIGGLGFTITSATSAAPVNGVCFISSKTPRSVCETNNGIYDIITRRCNYTQQYCQSLGMCFTPSADGNFCSLPSDLMYGVSFAFNNATPREWIRINGCKATAQNVIESATWFTPLGLFTKSGQTFYNDMLKNHDNWGEGLKNTLSDPMAATIFAQMFGLPGVTRIMLGVGDIAASMLGRTSATAIAERFAVQATIRFGAQAGILAGASMGPQIAITGIFLAAMAIEIGMQFADANLESGRQIPNPKDDAHYASNYTVGGWVGGDGQNAGKYLGMTDGWVTKPLGIHSVRSWPPTAKQTNETVVLPIVTRPKPRRNKRTRSTRNVAGGGECVAFQNDCTGLPGLETNGFFTPNDDLTAALNFYTWSEGKRGAIDHYLQTHAGPGKETCHWKNKIWAGGSSRDNTMWCMNPFPGNIYTDTNNIGPLTPPGEPPPGGTSREVFVTSNTWTDGTDFFTAQYPMPAVTNQATDDDHKTWSDYWFYQLSYDKENMVGMNGQLVKGLTIVDAGSGYTSSPSCTLSITASPAGSRDPEANATGTVSILGGRVTTVTLTNVGYGYTAEAPPTITLSSGCGTPATPATITAAVSDKAGYPKHLWNTQLLQTYFTDATISSMRRYYCSNSLKTQFDDGSDTHPKCWGYLSLNTTNFRVRPMTTAGRKL
jgi:hypothetical protein